MKEVMFFFFFFFLYIVDISFGYTVRIYYMCKKSPFFCLVACFLLLFEKAVFEKPKNLVIYTDFTFQTFQFLNSCATILTPFFFVVLPSL